MRLIKFRAWHKKLKAMFLDVGVNKGDVLYDTRWYRKDEVVLMQYTGLRDMNGREIYEGDILGEEDEPFAIVVWVEEEARFGLKFPSIDGGYVDKSRITLTDWFDHWRYRNWKVIGNIYENPELLDEERRRGDYRGGE